jgi:hypothetical protein
MILLWGLRNDPPLRAVEQALRRLGAPVFFLDQREVLASAIELCVDRVVSGRLGVAAQQIELSDLTAVYLRPHDSRQIPAVARAEAGSAAWQHALQFDDILLSWIDLAPVLAVNRPAAMAANNSKPYQQAQIGECGFATPDTLITTDPAAARKFWSEHGTVIYKSVSGIRSIVSRLTPADQDRLEDIRWCPTQFQQYIPGTDYRVHVVGDAVFACEIVADADDYRYAARQGGTTRIRSSALPEQCADRCRGMAAAMELPVAGIDLRRTPAGEWYCFEVNPSPGFTYYQEATGQPIDTAIAHLLMRID